MFERSRRFIICAINIFSYESDFTLQPDKAIILNYFRAGEIPDLRQFQAALLLRIPAHQIVNLFKTLR